MRFKGTSESQWDDILDRLGPVFGVACDDAHSDDRDVFGGWIMVNAAALNHPFWKGDLVVVRYVFMLFSAPLLFIIARAGQELIGGMFRGLSRILPI